MKQTDLAEALGVTPAQVSRDKARGMPVHLGVEACRQWRRENVRGRIQVGARMGEGAYAERQPEDYHVSRARREAAEADRAELELATLRGDLVRTADVRAAHARRVAALREAMLQLPSRVVPLLVAQTDPAGMEQVLQKEIVHILEMLRAEGGA